jgi:uncharacterized protein YhaN
VERLRNLDFLAAQLRQAPGATPAVAEVRGTGAVTPPDRPWGSLAVVLAVLAVAAFVVGMLVPAVGAVLGAALAVALGLAAAGAWVMRRRGAASRAAVIEAARRDDEARLDALRAADEARTTQAVRAGSLDAERTELLSSLGVVDTAAAEALLTRAAGTSASVERLRAELTGLLGEVRPLESLRAERDAAAAQAAQAGHALEGMGALGADPESGRLRAQAALRAASHRQRVAIEELGQAAGRVSQSTVDAEAVAALAEELAARSEVLAALERRVRIYEQTLAAIVRAEAATMQRAARYLERHMGRDIGRITDGRYELVRVNETDLSITVWSAERGDWVETKSLSRGTIDQLYLVARLGLVRQVTQDRRPPLVFDDPFVSFDDERAARAVQLLRELAAEHQVLYLTCSERYDDAADAVIVLEGPADLPVWRPVAIPVGADAAASPT